MAGQPYMLLHDEENGCCADWPSLMSTYHWHAAESAYGCICTNPVNHLAMATWVLTLTLPPLEVVSCRRLCLKGAGIACPANLSQVKRSSWLALQEMSFTTCRVYAMYEDAEAAGGMHSCLCTAHKQHLRAGTLELQH